MRREGIKSPDLAEALMLAFAEYYPEEWQAPKKTAIQKWSEKLEGPPEQTYDGFQEFANEFYKMDGYALESDPDREDAMLWD
jgi:hypothetical protein